MPWWAWLLAAVALYALTSKLVMRAWRRAELKGFVAYLAEKEPGWRVRIQGEGTLLIRGLGETELHFDAHERLHEMVVQHNLRRMRRADTPEAAAEATRQAHERWRAAIREQAAR